MLGRTLLTIATATVLVVPAHAGVGYADAVHEEAGLGVEVWTDRGSDAVYRDGEQVVLRVRPAEDSYVVVYGVDPEGMVELVYPLRDRDPRFLQGGITYTIDAPFLAVGAMDGLVHVQAVACAYPIEPHLPAFFHHRGPRHRPYRWGTSSGFVARFGWVTGDPYLALAELRASFLPARCRPRHVGFATASWACRRPVYYPRYVCADCHHGSWYDPYGDHCSVFDIRVDVWWTDHYDPFRCVPRYSYWKKASAPSRYRDYRTKWSSKDRGPYGDRDGGLVRNFAGKADREQDHLRKHHEDRVTQANVHPGGGRPIRDPGDRNVRDDRGDRDDQGGRDRSLSRDRVDDRDGGREIDREKARGRDRDDRSREKSADRPRSRPNSGAGNLDRPRDLDSRDRKAPTRSSDRSSGDRDRGGGKDPGSDPRKRR